jgi:hypothetical protein
VKSLYEAILNGLTYRDLAGRRQLRLFAVIAITIFILLIILGLAALLQRSEMMQDVSSIPLPVEYQATEPPAPQVEVENSVELCPSDPADWALADIVLDMNYKTIQPACVYTDLGKTVAWVMAIRSGYSRADAQELLGFDEMPVALLDQISIPNEGDGLDEMSLRFAPPHPDLREWRVDQHGEISVAYGLRGCFRTSSVAGNRIATWNADYAVICVVVEDANNIFTVYSLDGHLYSAHSAPMRSYLLFGYSEELGWLWLGTQESPKIAIDDWQERQSERETVALLFDAEDWDADWLLATRNLSYQELPEDWLAARDDAEGAAILALLDAYLQEVWQ